MTNRAELSRKKKVEQEHLILGKHKADTHDSNDMGVRTFSQLN